MIPAAGRLEAGLYACLLAVLVWAPLPFASNRVWGAMLLTSLVAALCLAWGLLFARGAVGLEAGVWRRGRWPLALLCLVQLWVWLQTVNLPRELVTLLSPLAAAWHVREGAVPLSLDVEHTRLYLLRGLAFTGGFFLTLALVNSAARVRLLLQTLVLSGTLQALYGAAMVLWGLELGFFVEKYAGRGAATGTFVNSNHLAGYLVLCLAAGTGLLLSRLSTGGASSWRAAARRWLRLMLSPKMRLRVYLAVMVIALVMTRSRMGNIAFFLSLGVAGTVALVAGRHFSWRIVLFLGSLFAVDLLILGRWFGFRQLLVRLEQTVPGGEERVEYLGPGLQYLGDFSLTGSGGGSWYGVFPNYQPQSIRGLVDHAHNDYLEFAAELGLPALLALGVLVLASAWQAWRVQRERRHPLYRGAGFAVIMACSWLLLHSMVDFSMQIPANALTACVLLAVAWVCRGLPADTARRSGCSANSVT